MLCSAVVVPTAADARRWPRSTCALMVVKARNEEAFLHGVHGEVYARYCARTGRFFPRFGGRAASARRDAMMRARPGDAGVAYRPRAGAACARWLVQRRRASADARATPCRRGAVLRAIAVDPAVEERVLALDPERISEREVRETLALAPAPRIINLHGSVPLVTMQPFAEFLIAMGYPAERLRNPRDGSLHLLELHRQPRARRQARVALRAGGHGADADRPQPGRDAGDQGPAGSRRRRPATGSRSGTRSRTSPRPASRSSIR